MASLSASATRAFRAIVKFLHQEKAEEADRGDNDENDERIGNRVAAPSGERFACGDRAE